MGKDWFYRRQELYSDGEVSDDEPMLLPKIDFEIVENVTTEPQDGDQSMNDQDEEFDFPLFSFGAAADPQEDKKLDEPTEETEERGRTQERTTVMKVSLRSPSPVYIKQERPKSYYFHTSTDLSRSQCEATALTYDQIMQRSQDITPYPTGKVIQLAAYNARIERELLRAGKKTRPGKKARLARVEAKKNKKERNKIQKKAEDEAFRKLMKKKNHKRGGKKNKKKSAASGASAGNKQPEKPKYRTE
ncbi:hypothetical protein BON22_0157 [Cyberlindnera fabianii]|uniref:Uncharacterized protein n=1 Tax=Cyberlindnera fabianii TaxID=36022 RepID=A0A1V2LCD2_CYBFA|nr:hypothetical protein BON22_0157 [Cyberlindnera fabianii]